jgi:hypothetical protein
MLFQAENIDWQCPAAQRLDELARRLPSDPPLEINVFGSAPLQLLVEPRLLSADIDLFGSEFMTDRLIDFVEQQGWTREKSADFYLQVCDPLAFKSTIDWPSRVISIERHGHTFHPWDILVANSNGSRKRT